MPTLYYISSSLTVISDNPKINDIVWDDISSLIVCSSLEQVIAFSGSTQITTFPIFGTAISYFPPLDINATITTPLSSSTFVTNWTFIPNTIFTSSQDLFTIYTSSLSPSSASISASVYISKSRSSGVSTLEVGSTYYAILSGSGEYYSSSLSIINLGNNTTTTITSSNSPISASFTSSMGSTINIVATTISTPYVSLTYSGSLPTSSTNVNDWNLYLTSLQPPSPPFNASSVTINTGSNSATLLGSNLVNLNAFSAYSSSLSSFTSSLLPYLQSFYFANNKLTSFPAASSSLYPSLNYIDVSYNTITGSLPTNVKNYNTFICNNNNFIGNIPEMSASITLNYFDCSYNNLSGSTPYISSNSKLNRFYCNNNLMSGSISALSGSLISIFDCSYNDLKTDIPSLLKCYSLFNFNCSNNQLSGFIPSLVSCSLLQTFNCSNNNLTGSIPSLINNVNLVNFNCSTNTLISDIPSLASNTQLQTFLCYNNRLSGSFPNLSNNTLLTIFSASVNFITGTLPNLANNGALEKFDVGGNILVGQSFPDLTSNINLKYFSISGSKNVTGNLSDIGKNPLLERFDVNTNEISGSIPDFTNSPNLKYFDCSFNFIDGQISTPLFGDSLEYFNCSNNTSINGSIPSLFYTPQLQSFISDNTALDGYNREGVSSTLLYFSSANCFLSETAVDDILYDLDQAGGVNGTVDLSGGSNAPPSGTGIGYANNLIGKGWTVSVN